MTHFWNLRHAVGLAAALVFVVGKAAAVPLDFSVEWSAPDRVVVPMKMRSGVPVIAVAVNGASVWMILDTGSEECVLEAATARRAGVRTIARAPVEVAGARGKESALVGVPDSFAVGAWRWRGLPCVVRAGPRAAVDAPLFARPVAFDILGASALRAMCSYVTLDFARGEAAFGFRQLYAPQNPAAASRAPFTSRHGTPLVKVAVSGGEWTALLDTGASSKMEIDAATAARFSLRKETRWVRATHLGLGVPDTAATRGYECRLLPLVECLGRTFRGVEAVFVEREPKLGSGLAAGARLTVDFARSQVWLEPARPRAP